MPAKLPVIIRECPVCGSTIETNAGHISRGRRTFCSRACNAKSNLLRKGATRHGRCDTGEYRSWAAMLQRCQNPRATKYPQYGGAGVTVCEHWQSFQAFFDDMGPRPSGTTIDRIEGAKGYEPGNCRWATIGQQQSNLRNNVLIPYECQDWTRAELARHLGLNGNTLAYRIGHWPEERWAEVASP